MHVLIALSHLDCIFTFTIIMSALAPMFNGYENNMLLVRAWIRFRSQPVVWRPPGPGSSGIKTGHIVSQPALSYLDGEVEDKSS